MSEAKSPPKVFISYRWSSPSHEEWVLRLATSLRGSGVNAMLDKWHLKEGQDTLAFMEGMVNDPAIEKVLLVCDKGYVDRANSREGGVGTEAQIVSATVYNDTGQDKFAAIVTELDDEGRPLLPTYMATRLYFDMSDNDAESVNFEKLLRWILNEPFHALPPIGEAPDFSGKTYVTGSPLFSVSNTLRGSSTNRNGSDAESVLQDIAEEAKTFVLNLVEQENKEEEVRQAIRAFRPVSENAYRALRQIVSTNNGKSADVIHSFFEKLLKRLNYAPVNVKYSRWDNDAYKYFVHDSFVSFVAIAMNQRAFSLCSDVLSMPFFRPRENDPTGEAVDYTHFRTYLESLNSLGTMHSRLSMHADLLNEGHEHSIVGTSEFMEADLTLHLRGLLAPALEWFPISGLYLSSSSGALPTYVRAKSSRFYDRLKPLLLNFDADSVRANLVENKDTRAMLRFNYSTLDVGRLIAAAELATSA